MKLIKCEFSIQGLRLTTWVNLEGGVKINLIEQCQVAYQI